MTLLLDRAMSSRSGGGECRPLFASSFGGRNLWNRLLRDSIFSACLEKRRVRGDLDCTLSLCFSNRRPNGFLMKLIKGSPKFLLNRLGVGWLSVLAPDLLSRSVTGFA